MTVHFISSAMQRSHVQHKKRTVMSNVKVPVLNFAAIRAKGLPPTDRAMTRVQTLEERKRARVEEILAGLDVLRKKLTEIVDARRQVHDVRICRQRPAAL